VKYAYENVHLHKTTEISLIQAPGLVILGKFAQKCADTHIIHSFGHPLF